MELNVYLGGWTMLLNPGVMILLSFALLADEYNTPDVLYCSWYNYVFHLLDFCILHYHQHFGKN